MLAAQPAPPPKVAACLRSLAADRPASHGTRDVAGASDATKAPACQPRPKLAARLQAAGRAVFASDAPHAAGEVSVAFAFAPTAGTLDAVEVAVATRVEGCLEVLTAADLLETCATLALDDPDDPLVYAAGTAPAPKFDRDRSSRNLHVAAAASPRAVSTESPRRGRGVAAIRLHGISTSRDVVLLAQAPPSSRARAWRCAWAPTTWRPSRRREP